jgi:predicted metal-dependent hydrolase
MNRAIAVTALRDECQSEALYSKLFDIYDQIRRERRIEVFGTLDFEVVRKIDGKRNRIAKLKGNRILVHVNAGRLPKSALRYIVAHEIAHTLTKRHTKRFWKIVESIYPTFETGQSLLMKYGSELQAEHKSLPD